VVTRTASPREEEHRGSHFIVSMPLQELVLALDPPAPPDVQAHARALKYRDFITVALVIRKPQLFPDNWIYIHTPEVFVGRIQNFKNWSSSMVPDASTTCLGLEYFCTEGDQLWSQPDRELMALARRETVALGFAVEADIMDSTVVRQKKAYPVYDADYRAHISALKAFLAGEERVGSDVRRV
jgi:protoporphyrinogen oxidase